MGLKFIFTYHRHRSKVKFILPSELVREIIETCIVKVELDGLEIPPDETPLSIYIVQSILSLNGLIAPGSEKLKKSLNFLKEYSLAQFQKVPWKGNPPPSWVFYVSRSYFSITHHLPFSKLRFVDEPFVLVEAWMTIAQAEHEYLEQLKKESERGVEKPHEPIFHLSPEEKKPTSLTDFLPIPPIPTEK